MPSHLLGVFKYYKLVLLPGIVSGLSIILEHPRNRYLNTVLWASLVKYGASIIISLLFILGN